MNDGNDKQIFNNFIDLYFFSIEFEVNLIELRFNRIRIKFQWILNSIWRLKLIKF